MKSAASGKAGSGKRHRELDLAIAACALTQSPVLRTLNRQDFAGIPSLELVGDD